MRLSTPEILLIGVLIGLIPAVIAQRKGRSFVIWWVFGFLLFIVALPWALLMADRRPRCPECREHVRPDAVRCPHCQSEIAGRVEAWPAPKPPPLSSR